MEVDTRVVSDLIRVSKDNQHRMGVDPFEVMLMRMGFRFAMAEGAAAGAGLQRADDEDGDGQEARPRRGRGEGGEGGGREEGGDLGWIENQANCRQS